MSVRHVRLALSFPAVLLCACDLAWEAPGIHQDVRGDWHVEFSELVAEALSEPCTLTGLVLSLDQGKEERAPGGSTVRVVGTYSPSVLTCGSAAPSQQPGGSVHGSIAGSQLPLTLSNSSELSGVIYRPLLSWTLVRLQGSVEWMGPSGAVAGKWQTEARETSSHF